MQLPGYIFLASVLFLSDYVWCGVLSNNNGEGETFSSTPSSKTPTSFPNLSADTTTTPKATTATPTVAASSSVTTSKSYSSTEAVKSGSPPSTSSSTRSIITTGIRPPTHQDSSHPRVERSVLFLDDENNNPEYPYRDNPHPGDDTNKKRGSNQGFSPESIAVSGRKMARNFMIRTPRSGRRYDVAQIECPRSDDRLERFACPTPDFRNRYRCIDDRSLCDGFYDCPGKEDENPEQCLFYKTTKAHLDILAEALLRWARGR
ncbi:uncharacterized protein [Lepeophtheirus salmonis]|uniref:uncharacterized protein n=1 Tax=Lepeophtheirus salmonis TaxID=72036 RepID=UPI001AE595A6|nr:putative protein TPRXL [Lepeophtheirus salmonis]